MSEQQLALYGFPKRSANETADHWKASVRNAKHRVCTSTPMNIKHTGSVNTSKHGSDITPKSVSGSSNLSNDWAGYEGITTNGYNEVDASWNVPCLKTNSSTGYSATWVGIGGDNNNYLIQAGAAQELTYIFWSPQYTYYAWFEDVAGGELGQRVFNVHCGENLYSSVRDSYPQVEMYLVDINTGNYFNHYENAVKRWLSSLLSSPVWCY